MSLGVQGAPGGAVEVVLPLERFAISGVGGSPWRPGVPEGGSDVAPGRFGGSPGVVFWVSGGPAGVLPEVR